MSDRTPAEHIRLAESFAEYADTDRFQEDTEWRAMQATLALAHATIALAQLQAVRPA